MKQEMCSCTWPITLQQTSSSSTGLQQHGQASSKWCKTTLRIRMFTLASLTCLNLASLVTSSTPVSLNPSHHMMIFIPRKGQWMDLAHLKIIDKTWKKYLSSEVNQALLSHNTKSYGKEDLPSTLYSSLQETSTKPLFSNFGYMAVWLPLSREGRPTHPHTTERADKKPLTTLTSNKRELLKGLKKKNLRQNSLLNESHQPSYKLTFTGELSR